MNKSVRQFAYLSTAPESIEDTRRALLVLSHATRGESACQVFDFFQDKKNRHQFILHEHFSHQDGYDAHLEAEYTKAFFSKKLVSVDRIVPVIDIENSAQK